MNNRTLGSAGEDAACRALKKAGLKILERNWRAPTGEIDIIAREKKTYVFIEVKTRSGTGFGRPSEAVTRAKQQHILRTAMVYLKQNSAVGAPVRFDVVEVLPEGVNHMRGAFDASSLPPSQRF